MIQETVDWTGMRVDISIENGFDIFTLFLF
jgi:hypothetical protein